MADARIRFNLDGLDEVRSSANSVFQDLINNVNSYNQSGEKSLEILRKEIDLLQRQENTEVNLRRGELREQLSSGQITQRQFDNRMQETQFHQTDLNNQTRILRELYDLLKLSKMAGWSSEKLQEVLKPLVGDAEAERIVNETEHMRSDNDNDDNKSGKGGFLKEFALANMLSPIKAPDLQHAITGLTKNLGSALQRNSGSNTPQGIVGLIMYAASEIADSTIGMLRDAYTGIGPLVGQKGGTVKGYFDNFYGNRGESEKGIRFGYSIVEYAQEKAKLAKSRGKVDRVSNDEVDLSLAFERLGLVDSGTRNEIMKQQRYGGSSLHKLTNQAIGLTGKDGDFSELEETLKVLTSINQKQLDELGYIDSGMNVKMLGAIMSFGGTLKEINNAQKAFNSLQKALTHASSPQMEALQFNALSNLQEGAYKDLGELMVMREKGMGVDGYAQKVMEDLFNASGGDLSKMQINFAAASGWTQTQSRELAELWMKDKDGFNKRVKEFSSEEVESRAEHVASQLNKAWHEAKRTNELMNLSLEAEKRISSSVDSMKSTLDIFKEVVSSGFDKVLKFFGLREKDPEKSEGEKHEDYEISQILKDARRDGIDIPIDLMMNSAGNTSGGKTSEILRGYMNSQYSNRMKLNGK